MTDPRQALLVVSFGGPEGPDEVIPFLERVTAGRNIPAERLRLVGQHYFDRGGVSPINEQCRSLIAELRTALNAAAIDLPIYWGNRNSAPFLADTIATMRDDGIEHAYAFVTSAYGSYSGCRQYRENIARARDEVGDDAPSIDKLRLFFNHPGFIEPLTDGLAAAVAGLDPQRTHVYFTAHSIPQSMADECDYAAQIASAADLVASGVAPMPNYSVVWQSRSGPPTMPWLEPDICDAIRGLDTSATDAVVVVPIGFISDHMEVIQDLDTDAAAAAAEVGVDFARVATVGTDPRFVDLIVQLVREQMDASMTPVSLGPLGLVPTQCGEQCCPPPRRPARTS